MKWSVYILGDSWKTSTTYPELTDNGWMITLLDGSLYFFAGNWVAIPRP